MKKQVIFWAVIVTIIIIAVVIYLSSRSKTDLEDNLKGSGKNTTSINYDTASNVDTTVPDINPINKANPFSGVKTNPFE